MLTVGGVPKPYNYGSCRGGCSTPSPNRVGGLTPAGFDLAAPGPLGRIRPVRMAVGSPPEVFAEPTPAARIKVETPTANLVPRISLEQTSESGRKFAV